MDTQQTTTKLLASKEYQRSHKMLKYTLIILKKQLEIAIKVVEMNEKWRHLGHEQCATYRHNGRRDKITFTPCNPVSKYRLTNLLMDINRFFKWEREYNHK